MIDFIESSAGRIAAQIQSIGAGFDPEVLSLPGGSAIAVFLWLYGGAMVTLKRCASRRHPVLGGISSLHELPAIEPVPAPACAGCLGHR